MNNTISQLTYPINTFNDTLLVQTKTHKDLLQIQAVAPGVYNLFHLQKGGAVGVLDRVNEQELNDKIVELCSIPSIEEDV
jgi:hypothetical protein